jgi:hypothetical protein
MNMTDKLALDYCGLWQHFSQEAASVKDKLWTIASWLFTLLGGIGFYRQGLHAKCPGFSEVKTNHTIDMGGCGAECLPLLDDNGVWLAYPHSLEPYGILRSKMNFTTEAFFQIVNKKYHGKA